MDRHEPVQPAHEAPANKNRRKLNLLLGPTFSSAVSGYFSGECSRLGIIADLTDRGVNPLPLQQSPHHVYHAASSQTQHHHRILRYCFR
ncbi:hypothetical protein IEQ34_022987 [Dendrobium chrysotoxum]|uniref:Uncharacterized protein n=1 Tax=Dendrobium chrysotoxum TaxID=161865 RepID=A0AAV7FZ86_DENCH|nr:hypothetical protein IEQ34_022987 [Dendrobium chrysotoxum]